MCGSDGLSSSSSLLICGKSCRCQAENPLNALPSFTRPALSFCSRHRCVLRAMPVGVRMPEFETLGPWLRRFLVEHIVTERNLARNPRPSYRDPFSLLLPFASRKLSKSVDRLVVCDLTSR